MSSQSSEASDCPTPISCPPESSFTFVKCLNTGQNCGQADRIDIYSHRSASLMVVRKVVKKRNNAPKYDEAKLLRDVFRPHYNPHICKWVSSYESFNEVRLYTEYCSYGDLDQLVDKYKEHEQFIPESLLWHVFFSVAKGLAFVHFGLQWELHKKSNVIPGWKTVLHRDIKPANIFMQKSATGRMPIIKIGDFGHAGLISDPTFDRSLGCGTRLFLPPEAPWASTRGDVWGLGSSITFMCISKPTKRVLGDLGVLHGPDLEALNFLRIKRAGYSREFAQWVGRAVKQSRTDRINSLTLVEELEPIMEMLEINSAFRGFPEWAVPEQLPGSGEQPTQIDFRRPSRGTGSRVPPPPVHQLTWHSSQSDRPPYGAPPPPPPARYSSNSRRPPSRAPLPPIRRNSSQNQRQPGREIPSSTQAQLLAETPRRHSYRHVGPTIQPQVWASPEPSQYQLPPPPYTPAAPSHNPSFVPRGPDYGLQQIPPIQSPSSRRQNVQEVDQESVNIRWSWSRGIHNANAPPQRRSSKDKRGSQNPSATILGADIGRNRNGHLQFERPISRRGSTQGDGRSTLQPPEPPPVVLPVRPSGRRQMPLAFDNRPGGWNLPAPEPTRRNSQAGRVEGGSGNPVEIQRRPPSSSRHSLHSRNPSSLHVPSASHQPPQPPFASSRDRDYEPTLAPPSRGDRLPEYHVLSSSFQSHSTLSRSHYPTDNPTLPASGRPSSRRTRRYGT